MQLSFVLRAVEMPLRLGNPRVFTHFPRFETADANLAPGSARPGIRASERPMVNGTTLYDEVVHNYLQIRKRGHECLSSPRDGFSTFRRSVGIDAK